MKNKYDSRTEILKQLVILGKAAERQLAMRRAASESDWSSLYPLFSDLSRDTISETSAVDYRRWISRIAEWAKQRNIKTPQRLSGADALAAIKTLYAEKVSAARICRFYKRVWKTIGLDDGVWSIGSIRESVRKEFYRRLSRSEVTRLVKFLGQKSTDYRDMVVIGYYTGLRLSDIAELNLDEISSSRKELHIIPNKVRTRRTRKLIIPLVREAQSIVRQRAKAAYIDGGLFKPESRIRPSRKISAAFRSCSINKIGHGRASFHSLRSTFISLMDEAGVLPYITDAITGHCAGDMHARYSQPAAGVLKRAILKAVPPLEFGYSVRAMEIGRDESYPS
jgi:integrase